MIPSMEEAWEMGAKGGESFEQERIAFEAWMKGHGLKMDAEWNGNGYIAEIEKKNKRHVCPKAAAIRGMWAAWRDRAALAYKHHKGVK